MTVGVFGIGNVLFGDDAFGPTVIEYLHALWSFPEGVVVEDLGTPSLALPTWVAEHDAVIFIDAVAASHPPGTVLLYERDAIVANVPTVRISQHEPTLQETLLTLEFSGVGPRDVSLIGVVPKSTDDGIVLSDEVRAAIPKVCGAVVDALARLGFVAVRREGGETPKVWWAA
jgi:hydrogenase maturation protease